MAYRNLDNIEFRKLHDKDFKTHMNSRLALYFNKFDAQCPLPPPYPAPLELNSSLQSGSTSISLPPVMTTNLNHIKEWYLIQQETSKVLLLINKADLILINSQNIQLNIYNRITFQRNNLLNHGRIINCSNNRNELEDELRKRLTNIIKINTILTNLDTTFVTTLQNEREISVITSASNSISIPTMTAEHNKFYNNNWFLIQFERNENCIIHSIIDAYKYRWDLKNSRQSNTQELYITDIDNIRRKSTILYTSNNRSEILNQMSCLTSVTFNMSFKNPQKIPGYSLWLLIQYSSDNFEYTYSIINSSTINTYKRGNLYPDVLIFIEDEKTKKLYQAIILKTSIRRDDLEFELENIKTNSSLVLFPLEEHKLISNTFYKMEHRNYPNNFSVDYLNFSRSTQTEFYYPIEAPLNCDVETECKNQVQILEENHDYTDDELALIRNLNKMEERMNEECHILRDAFYRLDRINTNMDREIMTLEYLVTLADV